MKQFEDIMIILQSYTSISKSVLQAYNQGNTLIGPVQHHRNTAQQPTGLQHTQLHIRG